MARYKPVFRGMKMIPLALEDQIQEGTFEFALNQLIDDELDLSTLDAKFKNDKTGATAYDPQVMLKIVQLGYSRGLISSRAIEKACEQNVLLMAMSGDVRPSYTHIAKFVRELKDDIQPLFNRVLYGNGDFYEVNGRMRQRFEGQPKNCRPRKLRNQCLRKPEVTEVRQVAFFPKGQANPMKVTEIMRKAIGSPQGRRLYCQRIGTVEPVFANLRHNKRLTRFTLRGQCKVNTQWNLYCLVHNIEKMAGKLP